MRPAGPCIIIEGGKGEGAIEAVAGSAVEVPLAVIGGGEGMTSPHGEKNGMESGADEVEAETALEDDDDDGKEKEAVEGPEEADAAEDPKEAEENEIEDDDDNEAAAAAEAEEESGGMEESRGAALLFASTRAGT